VLDDVTAALLNPKILSPIFEESPMIGVSQLRPTLESVALSSIMKLDKSSMDKLFDLMIMMVKYQLRAATGPREVILITLNHVDAMRDMVSDVNAQKYVSMVHQMIVNVSAIRYNQFSDIQFDKDPLFTFQSAVLRSPDLRRGLECTGVLPERTGTVQRASLDSPATRFAKR